MDPTRALARTILASLIVVAMLLVAAVAWHLRRPSSLAAGSAATRAPATNEPAPPSAAPLPAVTTENSPTRAPIEGKRAAPETVAIDCSVVVLDENDTEHSEEDGSLTPGILSRANDPKIPEGDPAAWVWAPLPKATVKAGSFRIEVPEGSSVGIMQAELGARPAHYVGAVSIAVAAGAGNEFRLKWIDGLRLHVVDATTHAELDDVKVVTRRRSGFIGTVGSPPRDALVRTVIEHGTSPVSILPFSTVDPRLDAKGQYYVVARGHAWKFMNIWNFDRRELTVELPVGASLDVEVDGELPVRAARGDPRPHEVDDDETAQLRLRPTSQAGETDKSIQRSIALYPILDPASFPGGRKPTLEEFKKGMERFDNNHADEPALYRPLICEQPAALGPTHLDGLLPGQVDVAVELGSPAGRPLCAARASVELVAGRTARVMLNLKHVQVPSRVPVAGTLHVPAAWSTNGAKLVIASTDLEGGSYRDRASLPLKDMAPVPGDPETLRFDAGSLPVATYRFSIESLSFECDLRVAAPDSGRLTLAIPEAATLYLTVVDAASGQPVPLKQVSWRRAGAWSLVAPSFRFRAIEGGDRLVATVPVGEGCFDLGLRNEWKLDPPASAVIHAGDQELTLRVHHATGVRLNLSCDGVSVPWTEEMVSGGTFESVDGDGTLTDKINQTSAALFVVSGPGRYRFNLAAIAGFAAVEPFDVDVPGGEIIERSLELHHR